MIPSVVKRDAPKRFERIFDEAHIAPAGYMNPAVEVLLIDDIAAAMLVRVAFSSTVSASVGYATVDAAAVRRIKEGLRWEKIKSRADECWSKPRQKSNDDDDSWTEGDISE